MNNLLFRLQQALWPVSARLTAKEVLLLLMHILKCGNRLRVHPERTEYVFLLRAYADILIPGRHLENFPKEVQPLPSADALAALPEGTLGHAYAQCLFGLQNAGSAAIEDYEAQAEVVESAQGRALRQRFHDERIRHRQTVLTNQHDLYHCVTGYDTSDVGELCLLAFQAAQIGNGLNLLLGLGSALRPLRRGNWRGTLAIFSSYRRGRRAQTLLRVDWSRYWAQPLSQVRQELGLS